MIEAALTEPASSESQTVAIPSQLLDRMCGRLQKVQMLPAIAQQALELAKDPECTIREFARIVEQDIKLAAEMLRIANSPVYCGSRPIVSLSEATVRLGLAHCKNLILTSSFASLIEEFTTEEAWVRDVLWRHGMATAVIASNLNRTLGAGFQGEEFTAGLMHDIGRILLAVAIPHRFLEGDPVTFFEDEQSLQREKFVFQTTHTDIGAWFAMGNRLPDCLVAAIRYHHQPARTILHRRLTALIAAADEMANYVQRNESAEGYEPASNSMILLLEQTGLRGATQCFLQRADEILENSCRDAMELCGA